MRATLAELLSILYVPLKRKALPSALLVQIGNCAARVRRLFQGDSAIFYLTEYVQSLYLKLINQW